VDINTQAKLAEKFGMTNFVNPKEVEGDLVPYLVDLTKAALITALNASATCHASALGVATKAGALASLSVSPVLVRKLAPPTNSSPGVFGKDQLGGARGRTDVPKIVDWYMEGKINIDDLITM